MHMAILVFSIFAIWYWGDWRNWKKYHTTMLYVAVGNLLYHLIYHDYLLWKLQSSILFRIHFIGESVYSFIILPCTALIFLTNYPENFKGQIFRIAKFLLIYISLEWIASMYGFIIYQNNWNFGWSVLWDLMMFPMLGLHYKRPLKAYIVSIFIVIIILYFFPMPLLQ